MRPYLRVILVSRPANPVTSAQELLSCLSTVKLSKVIDAIAQVLGENF